MGIARHRRRAGPAGGASQQAPGHRLIALGPAPAQADDPVEQGSPVAPRLRRVRPAPPRARHPACARASAPGTAAESSMSTTRALFGRHPHIRPGAASDCLRRGQYEGVASYDVNPDAVQWARADQQTTLRSGQRLGISPAHGRRSECSYETACQPFALSWLACCPCLSVGALFRGAVSGRGALTRLR
jgi:hypothetical protein